MHKIDGYGSTVDNQFTEGDPAQAVPATDVTAPWLNSVQGELVSVIEDAGLELNKADNSQLLRAIELLGSRPVPSIAALRERSGNKDGESVRVLGYYAPGDGGGGPVRIWRSGEAPTYFVDNGGSVIVPSGSDGSAAWVWEWSGPVNIMWFGAKAGTDSTSAVKASLDATGEAGIPFSLTPFILDSVSTSRKSTIYPLTGRAFLQLKAPAVPQSVGIILQHSGSKVGPGIHIDGNNTGRSSVALNADDCEAYFTSENVNSDSSSSSWISGLEINDANGCKFLIHAKNHLREATAPNDSVPRIVTIQGTSSDYHGYTVEGKNVNGGVTIGSATGPGIIETLKIEGGTDNGIYSLGGNLHVGKMLYLGSEEAVVAKGNVSIDHLETSGSVPLGLDGSGGSNSVKIGLLTVKEYDGSSPTTLFRTRSGNVATGTVEIGRISGVLKGETLGLLTVGTIEYLTIGGMDLVFLYDPAVAAVPTSWLKLDSCKGFNIGPSKIEIRDTSNVSTDIFYAVAPGANLTKRSFWIDVDVHVTRSDGTASGMAFRGNGLKKELIHERGCRWQINVGPYAREVSYGEPETVNGDPNYASVSFYGRLGQRLYKQTPSAGSAGFACSVEGAPGTWVAF